MSSRKPQPNASWLIQFGEGRIVVVLLCFMVGTLSLAVAGNSLGNIANEWPAPGRTWVVFIVSLLIFVILAVILSTSPSIRRLFDAVRGRSRIAGYPAMLESEVRLRKVLIVMVGPNATGPEPKAIDLHLGKAPGRSDASARVSRALEVCWLIHTDVTESFDVAVGRKKEFGEVPEREEDRVTCRLWAMASGSSVKAAYTAVDDVLKNIITGHDTTQYDPVDIIVDVTGGTKMMTMGAVLSCQRRRVDMQYLNQTTGMFGMVDLQEIPNDDSVDSASEAFGGTGDDAVATPSLGGAA